jgi:UDP-MurNAc hydroxylase
MVKDGESLKFKEFTFTLFAPFEKHNFHEAKVGNLIDSALVISDAEHCILNANDNTPSTESARQVRDRFGDLDLVMLNYNAAGPYPSCFTNLTIEQRLSEHSRILSRNFDHISALLEVFQSRAFLPFAGAYVIGGSQWEKNAYLGTTTWDVCREEVLSRRPSENILVMREMQTLDLESLTLDSAYEPLDVHHMREYIESELSSLVYPYELDSEPDLGLLVADLRIAARRGAERSARFGLRTSFRALIEVGSEMVQVVDPECAGLHSHERELVCRLDPRLLRRILDRRAHWNNAEIGCHINFDRRPNEYDPDLHTILQFVHL